MPGIDAYGNEGAVYLFFGILGIGCLFFWSWQKRKKNLKKFAHWKSLVYISDSISLTKRGVKWLLICLIYLLLVYSLMRPQGIPRQGKMDGEQKKKKSLQSDLSLQKLSKKNKNSKKVKIKESARDIIFLLDVSASMGVGDLYPSRLEKAKDYIRDILSVLKSEHVGLVVFTSVPSTKCVLTLDYEYFKDILKSVKINDNDFAGTKFTPSLKEILDRQFDQSSKKYKELILFTDGGDTDLESLQGNEKKNFENSIISMIKEGYKKKKIRIHTVGLGTKGGSIISGYKDDQGKPVRSTLKEDFLKKISKASKGIYVPAEDNNVEMDKIYLSYIGKKGKNEFQNVTELKVDGKKFHELIQKQREEQEEKIVYREYYGIPLFFAILLLIMEFFLSEKKKTPSSKESVKK